MGWYDLAYQALMDTHTDLGFWQNKNGNNLVSNTYLEQIVFAIRPWDMKMGIGRRVILIVSICAVLAGCTRRNLPIASPTKTESVAKNTVLITTTFQKSTQPATRPAKGNGVTLTPEAENTQKAIQPELSYVMDMQFIMGASL